jgi:hypothetical protein
MTPTRFSIWFAVLLMLDIALIILACNQSFEDMRVKWFGNWSIVERIEDVL